MPYTRCYDSPLGEILLAADEQGLTGLWFVGQKYFPAALPATAGEPGARALSVFAPARQWLDVYFTGREPQIAVPLHLRGTAFQLAVWELLRAMPYGTTRTYGALARELAARQGRARLSAQAVGGAVGRNPLSLFVPCHRVVGADGSLTGYAGGLEKKRALLQLEGAWRDEFFLP